jgi:two-component system, NarL family, sensor kinase
VLPLSSNGQNTKLIDSLQLKLNNALSDTNKVKTLIQIGIAHQPKDSTKAIAYFAEANKLALKLNFIDGEILSNINLGVLYYDYNKFERSIYYYKQAEILEKKYAKEASLTKLYSNMGNTYTDWGKTDEGIKYYFKSIDIALKYDNKKSLSIAYGNLGNTYIQQGNYVQAIQFILKAVAIKEVINDEYGIALMSTNLSVLYKELEKYDEAILYANNALKYYNKKGLKVDAGRVYVSMGLIAKRQKDYNKALFYFDEGLARFKGSNYTKGIAAVHNNKGLVLRYLEKHDEALQNFKECLAISNTINDKAGRAGALVNIAEVYIDKKDFVSAEESLVTALEISKESKYLSKEKEVTDALTNLYLSKEDYKKAFDYKVATTVLKDSILLLDKIKVIEETKTKYETEKKQLEIFILTKSDSIKSLRIDNQQISIIDNLLKISNQKLDLSKADLINKENDLLLKENDLQIKEDAYVIKTKEEIILQNKLNAERQEQKIILLGKEKEIKSLELTKKNNTIIGISILALLSSLIFYLFYNRNKIKQAAVLQAAIIKQQDISTKGIIEAEERERKRIASDLHDGVGQLMTAAWLNMQAINEKTKNIDSETTDLLNKAMHLVDESCKEVRAVSHNMMPNALLKKGLVNAIREFLQQINIKSTKINLQTDGLNNPLSNHIETVMYRVIQESVNNVIKHAQATSLDISINQDETGIDVMIEDNGKGFNFSEANKKDGIGLQNIKSRIEYLKGTVEWNTAENKGTLVAIHIPETK